MSTAPAPAASQSWGSKLVGNVSTLVLVVLFVVIPVMKVCNIPPLYGSGTPSIFPGDTNPLPGMSGGGTGGADGGSAPSPSSSPTLDPRQDFFNKAVKTTTGERLQDQGYEPAAVYELAPGGSLSGSNGQIARWLNGFTGREGAYVLFRNRDYLNGGVSKPEPGIRPDRVVLTNSGSEKDGQLVAYAQDFADGRGTICVVPEDGKFDPGNPNSWYELNKMPMVRGASIGNATRVTVSSTDPESPVPSGAAPAECMVYSPDQEEIPAS